jgi:hypothetical protein
MTLKTQKTTIPARGMNVAKAYIGVAPNTLRKMVALGLVPQPVKLPGLNRLIFDRVALDAVLESRVATP